MKKLLFALLAIAVSPPLFAQVSGTITSSQLVCIGVSADHSTVGVQVTGTWTGTLQPQVAIQGQALTNSQVVPSTSTTAASTITANGVYYANVGSASQFCILGNTVASGSAVVFLNAAKGVNASTLGGGGAGSGTVTNTGGALTLNSPVLGAGGADTKVSTGITSNGASEVDLGVNGGAVGVLGLNGNTSGKATITAPAVAGTTTNPIAFSNNLKIASSGTTAANAALQIGAANSGLYDSSNAIGLTYAGTLVAFYNASGLAINTSLQGNSSQHVLLSSTAPTISSGFGSSPSVAANNGTGAFTINVGTGGVASTGVIGLPLATAGWYCTCTDITTTSSTVFSCKQTGAGTTTTAPIGEFTAAGAAQAWTASDILNVSCHAF